MSTTGCRASPSRVTGSRSGDSVKVGTHELLRDPDAHIVYYFDHRLRLGSLEVNDAFRSVHRQLAAAGELDHPLTDKEINELRNIRYLKPPAW